MSAQRLRARFRRAYLTADDRFDLALELFPGAAMILGGALVIASAVF